MKPIVRVVSIFALCLGSCGSHQNSNQTKTIRLNLPSDPPSLDPRKPSDTTSIAVIRMCFDGLMRRDKDGNRSYGVAKSFQISDDNLTYTFCLKDTLWNDGTSVTAQNFVEAFKTILDPNFASEFANDLYVIKNAKAVKEGIYSPDTLGVRSLSNTILEITLEHPVPYFLDMLMTHAFFPIPSHKIASDLSWSIKSEKDYVCNGPFQLKEWKHYNKIELIKNENYWDANAVSLEKVELYMVEDGMTELSMYQKGELDYMGSPLSSIPSDALDVVSKEDEFATFPISGTYFYIFNTTEFPLTNKHIRRAFSLAIERKEIVENVLRGGQTPALSFLPPTMIQVKKDYIADADVEMAKAEFLLGLKELNLSPSNFPTLKLSYNTHSAHHKIAQAIQQQWASVLGVNVELENMEWKVFLDKVHSRQFQIARMGGVASYNDPVSFLKDYKYKEARINPSGWSNKKYSELLDISDTLSDPNERMKALVNAEEIFMQEMPLAPIYFYSGNYLKKNYVQSIHISELSDMDIKYCKIGAP